jgi:hypothetical protein
LRTGLGWRDDPRYEPFAAVHTTSYAEGVGTNLNITDTVVIRVGMATVLLRLRMSLDERQERVAVTGGEEMLPRLRKRVGVAPRPIHIA